MSYMVEINQEDTNKPKMVAELEGLVSRTSHGLNKISNLLHESAEEAFIVQQQSVTKLMLLLQ